MVLRKSTEQIAIMRRAGRVVAEMHEACILAAKPGATTADLDAAALGGARSPRRRLELPQLPRLPRRGLHLTQRGDRARHPRRPRDRRRRHRLDRLRRHRRGLARRRRDHDSGRRGRRRIAAGSSSTTEAALDAAILAAEPGNRLGDIGAAVEAVVEAAGIRSCASTSATASEPRCTRIPQCPTTARPAGVALA